jgi:hypothetical protein
MVTIVYRDIRSDRDTSKDDMSRTGPELARVDATSVPALGTVVTFPDGSSGRVVASREANGYIEVLIGGP